MKNVTLVLTLLMGISCITIAQSVTIGTQVWMTKNLDVITFRNGDTIPHAKTEDDWKKAGESKKPAWCYYDNDSKNGENYGKLYNWYAVKDPRGMAPAGWHVPSDDEWIVLTDYLGGESVAGGKIKSIGTEYWKSPNHDATNKSSFSGLPGGERNLDGTFYSIGDLGYWWSSTENGTDYVWIRFLYYVSGGVYSASRDKVQGFSVRCLKD